MHVTRSPRAILILLWIIGADHAGPNAVPHPYMSDTHAALAPEGLEIRETGIGNEAKTTASETIGLAAHGR